MKELAPADTDEILNKENISKNKYVHKNETDISYAKSEDDMRALSKKEEMIYKRDESKIAEIRASLNSEINNDNDFHQYLKDYLELKEKDVEKIGLLKAENLPENYKLQLDYLKDDRLKKVTIAVVPDDLWIKGSQPSESHAEKQLILIRESYYKAQEKIDEIAWMLHELAHCENFLDSKSIEDYLKKSQEPAFGDLNSEYIYPNNKIEKYTFTKQFKFLKVQGINKEGVLKMLNKYYNNEDLPFFNKLLDKIYI